MALNIKNGEAEKLAHKLSELTGESLTAAVTEALRERLERVQRSQDDGVSEQLLRLGKECAARIKEPYRSLDHGDLLYDERGLPK
jgi:antitoxin VapB